MACSAAEGNLVKQRHVAGEPDIAQTVCPCVFAGPRHGEAWGPCQHPGRQCPQVPQAESEGYITTVPTACRP